MTAIPLEDFDIDYVASHRDFITPVFFPFNLDLPYNRVLYVEEPDREVGEVPSMVSRRFPRATVDCCRVDQLCDPGFLEKRRDSYQYIIAVSIGKFPGNSNTDFRFRDLFTGLASMLAPGGIAAAATCGFAGYYGLEMVSRIVHGMITETDTAELSNVTGAIKNIVSAVVKQLPADHPSFFRPTFMERLKNRHEGTIKHLLGLNEKNIFTVTRLLEEIEASEAVFAEWMFPSFYAPSLFIDDSDLKEQMPRLPFPYSAQVGEQVNGFPPDHFFFLRRRRDSFFRIPLDSPDIFLWRPVRLPFYRWQDLSPDDAANLQPIERLNELFPVSLRPWEVQFLLSADGTRTVDQLQTASQRRTIALLNRLVDKRVVAVLPPC